MAVAVPDRVFLGWDVPLLEAVTDFLLADPEALPETLVVVPTSNSGRRLRQELSGQGRGVLAPQVAAPRRLFEVNGCASSVQALWAWVRTMQSINVSDFPSLFPNHVDGTLRGFRPALALANKFVRLRDHLADADRGFRDALDMSPEKNRWKDLCVLENWMLDRLKSWRLGDPVTAKRNRANAPELPVGVNRIVVAGVADPSLLALKALGKHLANGVPVTVLVHAPDSESAGFDAWGLPDVEAWNRRTIVFPDWQSRMHLVDDASEAGRKTVELFGSGNISSDGAALGLCDQTLATALEGTMNEAGWRVYDPEGGSAVDSGFGRLLSCCAELLGEPRLFEPLRELVRIPGVEFLLPDDVNRNRAAKLMDALHDEHLPETVGDAIFLADSRAESVMKSVTKALDSLCGDGWVSTLQVWLTGWLGGAGREFAKHAEPTLADVLDAIIHLIERGEKVTPQEAMEMLFAAMKSVRIPDASSNSVLDMQGWLELAYDSAPHLILAGMHEGCVPDGTGEDEFLPDQLKSELGMRDGRGRSARDAFLLTSVVSVREQQDGGRVDILVARFNDMGEARKPSRLLMRCPDQELADVVKKLFEESGASDSHVGPWTRDWTLGFPEKENPYAVTSPKALSPSAIKDYLNCPLRFFLKRVIKMDAFDAGKREMDALDFGNLCHGVLEVFGNDTGIRDAVDADEIEAYLLSTLDAHVEKIYGKNIGLPVIVQTESARERLRAFSKCQAQRRTEGWRIMHSEFQVGGEGVSWSFAGHPVRMMVDRIDMHEESGNWAVWDYKTTGNAKSPEEQHLKSWREAEQKIVLGDLFPRKDNRSKYDRRWADVQLPLYAVFVQNHFSGGVLPEIGYINLPRAVGNVGFSSWKGFDEQILESALEWGKAAVEKIISGEFRHAAEITGMERDWDDFSELAPDGLAAAFGLNQD